MSKIFSILPINIVVLDEYTNSTLVTASWSSVDTVPQDNEETLTFSLMVTMNLTSFNDIFNYRGYRLKR